MQPKNFPERKNRRRKLALLALERRIAGYSIPPRYMTQEADLLAIQVVGNARDVRTKKWRGGGEKPA